jgi:hypothetical protein
MGSTITTAGMIPRTFAVLAVAGGSAGGQIQQIGYGCCGVLMDTFLLRSLPVPSLSCC